MKRWPALQYASSIIAMACILVFGLGIAHAATPGVTDREVRIGTTVDLSGPIAFLGKGTADGARMYFDYINAQGGVHGRSIRFLVEDDGYQSPRAVSNTRRLVTRENVFCMFRVMGSSAVNAMYPFCESQGVPILFPVTQERGMAFPPRELLFIADATYTIMGKIGVEYFIEELGVKKEDMRIAVIYQDDTPGHDYRRGVKIGAEHYGLDVLELPFRRGSVDFSSHVARARNQGITHIFIWAVFREPPLIMAEAMRIDYKATYVLSIAGMTNAVLRLAGKDVINFSNGLYGFGAVLNFEDPNPHVQRFMDLATKNNYDYTDLYLAYGYFGAQLMVEALERAGRNLTREGIIRAIETFENVESGIFPPVTFGPDRRDGARVVGPGKAVDGVWVQLLPDGEWLESGIDEE